MKMTLNFGQFYDNWPKDRLSNFSYDGLKAIFDYLDGMDEELEFDPIAICCDFTEYNTWSDFIEDHPNYEDYDFEDGIEKLQNQTNVLLLGDDNFIIDNF